MHVSRLIFGAIICAGAVCSLVKDWSYDQIEREYNDVNSLLVARQDLSTPALLTAKTIIDRLSHGPSCGHKPTAQLIRQCKIIRPKSQDPEASKKIENARYVYAISMSACEMQRASEPLPYSCQMFGSAVPSPSTGRVIQFVSQTAIDACLKEIKTKHQFWTTYDNFRQQSTSLCDASRLDHAREDLLAHYEAGLQVHEELLEALKMQQQVVSADMAMFRQNTAELLRDQEKLAEQHKAGHEKNEKYSELLTSRLATFAAEIASLQGRYQDAVSAGSSQAEQGVQLLQERMGRFEMDVRRFMHAAAEAMTEATFGLQAEIDTATSSASQLGNRLGELAADKAFETVQEHIDMSRAALIESSTIHQTQLDAQRQQMQFSQAAVNMLQQAHEKMEDLVKVAEIIPSSWFDSIAFMRSNLTVVKRETCWLLAAVSIATILCVLHQIKLTLVTLSVYVLSRILVHTVAEVKLLRIVELLADLVRVDIQKIVTACICVSAVLLSINALLQLYRQLVLRASIARRYTPYKPRNAQQHNLEEKCRSIPKYFKTDKEPARFMRAVTMPPHLPY